MPPSQSTSRALGGRAIWKFTIEPWQIATKMPKGARLVHAHEQAGEVCVWAEVDPQAPLVTRRITAAPTGVSIIVEAKYVGTAHLVEHGTPIVLHVYDGGEVEDVG